MCIVVDINTLPAVFSETCDNHPEFAPVKAWIEAGNGFLVFGGTKYKAELQRTFRYLRMIRQMQDAGLAVAVRDVEVDLTEREIIQRTEGTDCDDQHIIALLSTSRCSLLCSLDRRSYPFVRDRSLFPDGMQRVRIYSSRRNSRLLIRMSRDNLRCLA